MKLLIPGLLLLSAALVAVPAFARTAVPVTGIAHVVDGDTVHLKASGKIVKVRLQGVAAPERHETGGAEATRFLRQLAQGRELSCQLDGTRSKDRVVGTCFVDGQDIGAAVIAAGLARDCARFSGGRYRALERPAAAHLPYPSYCVPR